jgi:hypothetical protein
MRHTGGAFVLSIVLAACAGGAAGPTTGPGATGGGQGPGGTTTAGGGGGSGILDAAKAAAAHACSLVPTDLVAGIVASPGPPQEELFPAQCSIYGDKTAIGFSIDLVNQLGPTPSDGTDIQGFPNHAYLEKLSPGNFTLYVALTPQLGSLLVEVDNSDGKDHTQEVVNLAKAILQKLGG